MNGGGGRSGGTGGEMPFLEHLEELRTRIIRSLIALGLGVGVGFWVVTRFDVLGLLIDPVRPYLADGRLHVLGPMDPFFLTLQLAVVVGLLLASPVIIGQIWGFVSPALKPNERRAIVPAFYFGLVLFACGVALAYFAVLPITLKFMQGFQVDSLQSTIVAGAYLGFVVRLLCAFGLAFELPVVVLVLSVLGIIDSKMLAEKRRYAFAFNIVFACLVTPADLPSTFMLLIPLTFLYEVGIWLARGVELRRQPAADPDTERWVEVG